MKGFTKDGKFHPIKPYNKVRKSRDTTTKEQGVRMKRTKGKFVKLNLTVDQAGDLGILLSNEILQDHEAGQKSNKSITQLNEKLNRAERRRMIESGEIRKARDVRGQFFKMIQPEAESFQAPQDEQDVDNFLMSLDLSTVDRALKKAKVFEIGDGDFFIKRVEIGNIERIFKQRKNESEDEYFKKLRLLEGSLLEEVENKIKIPLGHLAVQIEDEDQILQIDWLLDMDNPAEKRFLEKQEGLFF